MDFCVGAKSSTVNPAQGEIAGPGIDIHIRPGEIEVRQRRPAVVASLVGKRVESALQLVPVLLPVCGQAQSVAASRAIAAARAQEESTEQQLENARRLWREQAMAAAWRCTVDWPDLLGEPRQLDALKRIRRAREDREIGAMLRQLVPGLEEVMSIDSLLEWVGDGGSSAARIARLAIDTEYGARDETAAGDSSIDALVQAAGAALAQDPFDPLDPEGSPREVGPLAMARDTLTAEIGRHTGSLTLARLLAQVLDQRVIYRALHSDRAEVNENYRWAGPGGSGVGCAITARGPVFHRVRLDVDRIADWRVLAPTDWHFGPRGPVVRDLRELSTPEAMRLLVVSYDPCAPWSLHIDGEGG